MRLARLAAAFLRRDTTIQTSYRLPFVLGLASTVFVLALFFYLGKLVDGSGGGAHGELNRGYFAFATVGLAVLQVLQVGMVSFAQKLRQEQTTGTFEALMSSPASPHAVIACSVVYDFLRATVSSLALLAIAIALFDLRLDGGLDSLAFAATALALCVVLFAALGIALAAFTVVFKQAAGMVAMTIAALALLSGVYFPTDLLPGVLEAIGSALPFTWGLDAIRSALLEGRLDGGRLAALAASALVAVPLALALFGVALRRARRDGSLAQD